VAGQFLLERVDDFAAALLGQFPGFAEDLAGRPDGQLELDRLVGIAADQKRRVDALELDARRSRRSRAAW
jgi:hypothetical protein